MLTLGPAPALVWIVGSPTFFVPIHEARAVTSLPSPERVVWLVLVGLLAIRALRRPSSLQRPGGLELAMAIYVGVLLLSWLTTVPGKGFVALKQDAALLA